MPPEDKRSARQPSRTAALLDAVAASGSPASAKAEAYERPARVDDGTVNTYIADAGLVRHVHRHFVPGQKT
jgi:hypothetical protein